MTTRPPTHTQMQMQTQVMGIVNVTPDSFSDGGRYLSDAQQSPNNEQLNQLCSDVQEMIDAGADYIDIGAISTRPGSLPISQQQEEQRLIPALEALMSSAVNWKSAQCSVDTSQPTVMQKAFNLGVRLLNDVHSFTQPGALQMAAQLTTKFGGSICLMHLEMPPVEMPKQMAQSKPLNKPVEHVGQWLKHRIAACQQAGIDRRHILVDPGIGFGKCLDDNLTLLAGSGRLGKLTGCPVLVGVSRKRTVQELTGTSLAPPDASPSTTQQQLQALIPGNVGAALAAAAAGASVVRVHDVAQTVSALRVFQPIFDQRATG